jgi:hypothetical protein
MSDSTRIPAEYELLKDVVALDLKTIDTKIENSPGDPEIVIAKMVLEEDPEVLSSCAWSLVYAIGVMSFADARPRGYSDVEYVADDQWYVGDMFRGLRFERGRIYWHADYVRGRLVKTSVEIDKEGKIVVETVNRGEALTRWIAKLQGKKTLGLVEGGDEALAETD